VGRLVVVPTPIGNLEDITLRAIRELRDATVILAEDTRRTRTLLLRYDIHTPLLSYHQHNKRARLGRILSALEDGDVALVSDAGMPSISDPGFELITAALDAGVEVDVLPGPSAVTTAVVAAAIPAPGFVFLGFLPRRSGDRRACLERLKSLEYALVLFEAPHRLVHTLRDALEVLGDRPAVAARELTKLHQQVVRGTLAGIQEAFSNSDPRGEITLVIGGASEPARDETDEARRELITRRAAGEDSRTAVAAVIQRFGISRNAAYRLWLETAPPTGP